MKLFARHSGSRLFLIFLSVLCLVFLGLTADQWFKPEQNLLAALQTHEQLQAVTQRVKIVQDAHPDSVAFLKDDVLPAEANSVNSAALLSLIKAGAANQGIEITRTSEAKQDRNDGINWVGVSIGLNATEAALLNFITEIEKAKPVMSIDKMVWQSPGQPGIDLQFAAIHSIEMDVSAVSLYNPVSDKGVVAP